MNALLVITFLIYALVWDCGIVAGTAYLVFWRGFSGLWFIPAVLVCSMSYKPHNWKQIVTGQEDSPDGHRN